ncbi:MAG TPA: peptidoglycan DD-metalloendopeptidase family protein [bacterium]|nr:peptidoglycan DD-metalloendopeptidase family protein [bacterium]HQO35527.1 peptidoglycan DD-metalloendopeptidase family protein [bacterium]
MKHVASRALIFIPVFHLVLFMFGPHTATGAPEPARQASQLRETIQKRQKEMNQLRGRREELERTAALHNQKLEQFDKQFRNYLANLENSEQRAETVETELLDLLDRAGKRDTLIDAACQVATQTNNADSAILYENAVALVTELFQQELSERPRREKLTGKLDEEQAYQKRIREHYMVNEEALKEQTQKQLETAENRAKTNLKTEQKLAAELKKMQAQLNALDEELARLRRAALKPKPAQPKPGTTKITKPETTQAPFQPGTAFVKLRGKLPWPAQGKVVRGYGPFTHPTLNVRLISKGVDVTTKEGAAIKAVADGRVLYIGQLEGYGALVALDHGDGYLTVYGNVEAGSLKAGSDVGAGAPIGVVGQKNRDEGPVYHFEIRRGDQALDPGEWLAR